MYQMKPTGNPLFPCTKRKNFCAINAPEQNLHCAPCVCRQEEKVTEGKLIASDTQHLLAKGTHQWQTHATPLERCHICSNPSRCTKTQTPRSGTATLLMRGLSGWSHVSVLYAGLQHVKSTKWTNGPMDPAPQGSARPPRASGITSITPALPGATKTANHALCYVFISPAFITVLPSFLQTASNIFKYV